jgi:surface polysaccharide O-acyltransferase-like enzyme
VKSLPESSAGEMTPAKNHLAWIDLLRVIAIFQVILIHVSFPVIGKEELSQSYKLAANFYDAFSRASVPLFFMVSGYLLLGRNEPVTNFLYRRFLKVGIPAVAWTAVYLIWHQEAYRDGSMNILRIGLSMVKAVFGGHFEIHLWFVYVLMGLYLIMPILRVLVSSSPFILNYFLALWLLANPFFSLLSRISGETVDASLRLFLVEGYAGFLILGYVLGQWTLPARGRWVALITFLVAAFAVYAGTNALSAQAGYFDDFLYDYLGFPVILMSASFFLWFKSLDKVLSERRMSFIKQLSDASFGIYLMHILVQEGLRKGWFGFSLYSWMGPPIYMIPLTGLAVFMISFGIVFVMKRIPVLKYAV